MTGYFANVANLLDVGEVLFFAAVVAHPLEGFDDLQKLGQHFNGICILKNSVDLACINRGETTSATFLVDYNPALCALEQIVSKVISLH